MQSRPPALIALAVALALPASAAGAQEFRYSPGTARYDASVVTHMTREMGGQRTDEEIMQSQRLTIGLTRAGGDTLAIGVTVDSAAVATRTGGVQDVSPLVGLKVDGRISTTGDLYSSALVGRDIGPTGSLVASELARFLPKLRRDLHTGLTWTDTTAEEMDMLGVPVSRRSITTSTVTGDTTVAGRRGWKIDRRSSVNFTGSGSMSGQQIRLEGSSTSEGVIVVSRAGRYLASEQTDSSTTKFTMPSTGAEIAMRQEQRTSVALVP